MYYGNRKDVFDNSNYCEYGAFRRKNNQKSSYEEYGSAKNVSPALKTSITGSAPSKANAASMKQFDNDFDKFIKMQEKIKAERIADRTKYCDEKGIQGKLRDDIISGKLRIEDYEMIAEQARSVVEPEPEAPVETVEAPVEEAPKKKSKKKVEVVEETEPEAPVEA